MDNATAVTNNTHNEAITAFLTSNAHFAIPDLGFKAGSALITQMGGDDAFLQAVTDEAQVSDVKKLAGLEDNSELQALYIEHKAALLSVVSLCCLGDDLVVIHEHSHTRHKDNNLPHGIAFSLDDTAQGLHSPTIVDNTADPKFLEAARYVCRRVVVRMLEHYKRFTHYNEGIDNVQNLLNSPVLLAGYDVYMPSNLASDLTELLGGVRELIAASENLDDGWMSTEFYDEPCVLSMSASVLPVFKRNQEAILSLLTQVATENNVTSAYAFIDCNILGGGYNPDMVAESYWSDTNYTGAKSLGDRVSMGAVSFATLMLCRTINAYEAGIDL